MSLIDTTPTAPPTPEGAHMPDLAAYTHVANDGDIQARVAACAATKGQPDPVGWAAAHRWDVATFNPTPGDDNASIAAVYAYAEATKTINVNQATGQRTDSVNDAMIEAAVDAILAAESA